MIGVVGLALEVVFPRFRFRLGRVVLLGVFASACASAPSVPAEDSVIVVGAGISGLSAAVEAASRGAAVTVVDSWSVFGGHAVIAGGAVCIVDTRLQRKNGISDSPELALQDFLTWGGAEVERGWAEYYARHSAREVHDWLTAMGVEFESVGAWYGNSVPRLHRTKGFGFGLVSPLYREALRFDSIDFVWNFRVDRLLYAADRVIGISGIDLRSERREDFRAGAVVLATGGFQSNLDLVREYWPRQLQMPERILAGSGVNSTGSGLILANQVAGDLQRMDRQWNYSTGLPDPRYPGSNRGLSAGISRSLWINREGRRFVNETASEKFRLPEVLSQPGATYWAIFDFDDRQFFNVSGGAGWKEFSEIEELILNNPELTASASSLDVLARRIGVPEALFSTTVEQFNRFLGEGVDPDYQSFSSGRARSWRIERPPFYAVQFFPLARKSMGGIRVDLSCRVLNREGVVIPGLLASGEVTGFGGINGSAALEGTFLGPAVAMGRVAGRTATSSSGEPQAVSASPSREFQDATASSAEFEDAACLGCHSIAKQIASPRPGFRHFELTHAMSANRDWPCRDCHPQLFPFDQTDHRWRDEEQLESCSICHLSKE